MADEDRRRWDERHAAVIAAVRDAAAGTPAAATAESAPPFVAANDAFLPSQGRALDVACGRGGATVALARRGLTVFALDVSLVALSEVRRRADAAGVARSVHTLAADLDDGLPEGLGRFDVVLCSHFHAPPLWPAFRDALAPGGVLVLETLTSRNVELGLAAPSPRFLIAPGEILRAAEGLTVLLHVEDVIDGAHRARLVARRS